MNGDLFIDDSKPIFLCFKSGHPGPYLRNSELFRSVACKECLKKAFPDQDWDHYEARSMATEIAESMRRVSKPQKLSAAYSDTSELNSRKTPTVVRRTK